MTTERVSLMSVITEIEHRIDWQRREEQRAGTVVVNAVMILESVLPPLYRLRDAIRARRDGDAELLHEDCTPRMRGQLDGWVGALTWVLGELATGEEERHA